MIGFESEPGVGTIFRVFLPKVDIDLHKKVSEASEIITGNERILFVDDEDMLVEKWGKATLERLGYHVVAETKILTRALKIFSSDPSRFDLVITGSVHALNDRDEARKGISQYAVRASPLSS